MRLGPVLQFHAGVDSWALSSSQLYGGWSASLDFTEGESLDPAIAGCPGSALLCRSSSGNRNAHAIPQDGVMNSDLTDLKNTCNARGVVSDSVKISEGESLWIIGLP